MTDAAAEWSPPYFRELHLRCGKCACRWMDFQPNNCRAEVLIAAIDALRCPECGTGPAAIFMLGPLEIEAEATYAR